MARISELHYSNAYARSSGVSEFLEVALASGEDPADFTVSFYNQNGRVGLEVSLTDPGVQVSTDPETQETVYVISADNFNMLLTDPNGGGSNNYEAAALTNTDTGTVIDYYDIGGGTQNILALDGAAAGAVSENIPVLIGPNQTTTTIQFNQPDPDSVSYGTVAPGDTGIVCFAEGSLIETAQGPRSVCDLKVGDEIWTGDAGLQPLRWIGYSTVRGAGKLAPICISKGTLGATSSLFLSPQHRVLVKGWRAELFFGQDEVLVPVVSLINGTTIRRMPCELISYYHFMFDRHHIVTAQGVEAESLFPGDEALNALSPEAFDEISTLFPDLEVYGETARPVQKGQAAALLV